MLPVSKAWITRSRSRNAGRARAHEPAQHQGVAGGPDLDRRGAAHAERAHPPKEITGRFQCPAATGGKTSRTYSSTFSSGSRVTIAQK